MEAKGAQERALGTIGELEYPRKRMKEALGILRGLKPTGNVERNAEGNVHTRKYFGNARFIRRMLLETRDCFTGTHEGSTALRR